jgi:hypothetical protein
MTKCPWIFDFEKEMTDHKVILFHEDYNIETHVQNIFSELSFSDHGFHIFDAPFHTDSAINVHALHFSGVLVYLFTN